MNPRASLLLTPFLLAPILLVSCDTTKAPGASHADPLPAAAYPQIAVDRSMVGYIVNGVPKVDHARIMSVTVPIRATTEHEDMRVQYRFLFFNNNGVPIGEANPDWRYQQLPSRTQVFLSGNATDGGAEDWRLELRPAR